MLENIKNQMKLQGIDTIVLVNNENDAVSKNVFYVSNFLCSSCIVVINQDFEYLITDFRYETVAKLESKLNVVIHQNGMFVELERILNEHGIKEVYVDDKMFYGDYIQLVKFTTAKSFENLFLNIRSVKTDDEVSKIKRACKITDLAYEYVLKNVRVGMSEIQVAKMLESKLFELGATKLSFDTIVASGARGALPHANPSEKLIEDGDLVTIDFGCYLDNYASDMTRTFGVGNVSDKLVEIYNVVLEAQQLGVESAKAGMTGRQLDKVCRDYIANKGYGEYFGHGTGHGLGLDVHELPSISFKNDEELLEGQIVTVEPGIYIPNLGGVRIEDDIVIRKNGCEILNKTPKNLVVIRGE